MATPISNHSNHSQNHSAEDPTLSEISGGIFPMSQSYLCRQPPVESPPMVTLLQANQSDQEERIRRFADSIHRVELLLNRNGSGDSPVYQNIVASVENLLDGAFDESSPRAIEPLNRSIYHPSPIRKTVISSIFNKVFSEE